MSSIAIIGAGFTGLAAAFELAKAGHQVAIYESDADIGGLAGTFEISPGVKLEKFYHHWFTSDTAIIDLISELGLADKLLTIPSTTGLYFANSIFRLSSPLDLLSFPGIPLLDRVRTGLMALYARRVNSWHELEKISAADWLIKIGGRNAYEVIWKPLLHGKFGIETEHVSAVWIWNKLKLRGSSRGKGAKESLLYFDGGFASLSAGIRSALEKLGVQFHFNAVVSKILNLNNQVTGLTLQSGEQIASNTILATNPLPQFLQISPELPSDISLRAAQIRFLGNVCLVLRLSQSLSSTYWLNVADPSFPFVGIIEHTNLDSAHKYNNERIVYLSKYLPVSDPIYSMADDVLLSYSIPFIKRMFPDFKPEWIIGHAVWRANYSQPIVTKGYSKLVPPHQLPIKGLWLATMAQVYPQDRGTNYAVEHGRRVAKEMLAASFDT